MDTPPAFGFKELFHHVIGDMAKAISERNGESKQQQFLRCQVAVQMIMSFLPRDTIEALLAGRCVMFHELMVETVGHTMRGEVDSARSATRTSIVAMDKVFANNLALLQRHQLRPSTGRRDEPEVRVPEVRVTEVGGVQVPVGTGSDAASPAAAPPAVPAQVAREAAVCDGKAQTVVGVDEIAVDFQPSPETIAACRANPEAMEALLAGDAERFARAMGINMPTEAYLAAAASQGIVLDREAEGDSKG